MHVRIVGIASLFADLPMMTGPMYMLQVHGRVPGGKSEESLIAFAAGRLSVRRDGPA